MGRLPKVLVKIKKPKIRQTSPVRLKLDYTPKQKSNIEKLYDIIDKWSCYGYRFCGNDISLPYIEPSDIEYKGDGVFVIRFRCPVGMERYGFPQMAKDVCAELKCEEHFWTKVEEEYGLKYVDGAWVLQVKRETGLWDDKEGIAERTEQDDTLEGKESSETIPEQIQFANENFV